MKKFIILFFLGGIIVLFSYSIGNYLGLESRKVWLISNVLHFLGGIYSFFFFSSLFGVTKKYHNTIATPVMRAVIFIFGALFLGVLWEWYELFFIYWDKVFILNKQSALVYVDTMGDLALDFAGALFAGFYFYTKNYGKNK